MPVNETRFAADTFDVALADDRRRLVLEHAGPAFLSFFPVVGLIGVVEWITRPGHRPALVLVGTLYALIASTCLSLLRIRPHWAVPVAVGGCSALAASMLAYSPLVRGSGELCVLALTVLMGGFAVAFPLGLRAQLIASIVPVVGYATVLQLGTTTAYPIWYSGTALLAFLAVLAVGARGADQHHARILRTALEQAAMAAENARLRDEARAADRAKMDLMSILSHELRSPLFGIRVLSEVLVRDGPDDAAQMREHAQRICNQTRQVADLVQTMLEFGSIETGALRVVIDEVCVPDLFLRLRNDLSAARVHEGVEVRWHMPADDLRMQTDRGKLESVLRNLLHNALRHTVAGTVELNMEADPSGDTVQLVVRDTGEGIAREALSGIFDRYARATSSGDGFGLGLYIVKRFVAALGGEISVDSTPGVGTCFAVRLPRVLSTRVANPPVV